MINSFVCKIDEIDICTFPFCKYSSVFGRFENKDSSSKSFADDLYSKGINFKIAIALVNVAKLRAKDRKFRDLV